MSRSYILGLNKYSQSTSCALIDDEGRVVFALARERLTRKKFDGGDVAELLRYALEQTGVSLNEIGLVVENCHLFRIDAFERRLRFGVGQHYYPASYLDEYNLADARWSARKMEITHHMAHAFGARFTAPFEEGLIVVMDGMGSLRSDVMAECTPAYLPEGSSLEPGGSFAEFPNGPDPGFSWREAESAYAFQGRAIKRIFKRWSPLRSPSLLYNYGFENMESLGAVYSRISSHIFKDWNACGKVMGLAGYGQPNRTRPLMTGLLENLRVDWEYLDDLTPAEAWDDPGSAELNRELAATVQENIETIALDFVRRLREKTGARNLVLTGGVALNSQLNALIASRSGFENVFVPSAPGDDGAALGCAAFGLYNGFGKDRPARTAALSPYLGGTFSEERLRDSLERTPHRIEFTRPADLLQAAATLIADGRVIGWFQGRSEYGPRALGNRSILAHPGLAGMADRLNAQVKHREPFRPFAPTVLADKAGEFFSESSPNTYMSFAVPVAAEKGKAIPAVVHVDNTARLQHLDRHENPLFYDLIRCFGDITGLPLLLNTSFNIAGEAIIETPDDALWTFLNSGLDALVMGPFLVTKKAFPGEVELARSYAAANPEMLVETAAQATGEFHRATLYHRGMGHEVGPLALTILDRCAKPVSCGEMSDALVNDEDVSREEVGDELRRLFSIGAILLSADP